jgi:hypothetical protein
MVNIAHSWADLTDDNCCIAGNTCTYTLTRRENGTQEG